MTWKDQTEYSKLQFHIQLLEFLMANYVDHRMVKLLSVKGIYMR